MGFVKKQRYSRRSSKSRSRSPHYFAQKPINDMNRHDSPPKTHENHHIKRKYSPSKSVSPVVQSKNKMPDSDPSLMMEEERPHKVQLSPDNSHQHENFYKQVRQDCVDMELPLVAETRQLTPPLSDSKQTQLPLPPINESMDRSVSSAVSSSSSLSRHSSVSRSHSPIENNNNTKNNSILHESVVDFMPPATAVEEVVSNPPPILPNDDNDENKLKVIRDDSVVSKRIPRSPSPPFHSKQTIIESNKDSRHREVVDERRFSIDKVIFV